jgi:G-patch domain
MSFGQKILEKYGFKQGEGLGKNGGGITEPIKANFKVASRRFVQLPQINEFCLHFSLTILAWETKGR